MKLEVLLIEDNREAAEAVRRMLATVDSPSLTIRLEWADTLTKGIGLLDASPFDAILLDLNLPDSHGFETFSRLRPHRRNAALIVLTAEQEEEFAFAALREGAEEYLIKGDVSGAALARRLRLAVERRQMKATERSGSVPPVVLGCVGVKGGAGTTTVALNIAAALARQSHRTVAIELKQEYGMFSYQLKHSPAANLSSLCALGAGAIDTAAVTSTLCTFPFGLQVLFGPQRPGEYGKLDPATAETLIKTTARMADRVVIDLPSPSSPITEAAVRQCDFVVMVMERDPVSVHAAKLFLDVLHSWRISQLVAGVVVVNRVMVQTPAALGEVAGELGCVVLGAIPPAIELCAKAMHSGSPVVLFEPDSTLAGALTAVAWRFSDQPSLRALRQPAG